jgi:GDPmannose 4,6-dehydratase
MQDKLFLGNLSAKRDWGHAKDYVKAMYLMLQQETAEDFVIATGVTTEVRDFVKMAFSHVGIELEWKGEGIEEKGYVKSCSNAEFQLERGRCVVEVDPRYFRPTEVELLIGNPAKAKKLLGWEPQYDLQMLVDDMMQGDIKLMKKEKYLKDGGFKTLNYFE